MTYVRKTRDEFEIQGNYGHGWETVVTEENAAVAREQLNIYNANEPRYPHRIKKRMIYIKPEGEVCYKLRVYKQTGFDKGNLDHEEVFTTREEMETRYNELFNLKAFALNPTAWELKNENWERILDIKTGR